MDFKKDMEEIILKGRARAKIYQVKKQFLKVKATKGDEIITQLDFGQRRERSRSNRGKKNQGKN